MLEFDEKAMITEGKLDLSTCMCVHHMRTMVLALCSDSQSYLRGLSSLRDPLAVFLDLLKNITDQLSRLHTPVSMWWIDYVVQLAVNLVINQFVTDSYSQDVRSAIKTLKASKTKTGSKGGGAGSKGGGAAEKVVTITTSTHLHPGFGTAMPVIVSSESPSADAATAATAATNESSALLSAGIRCVVWALGAYISTVKRRSFLMAIRSNPQLKSFGLPSKAWLLLGKNHNYDSLIANVFHHTFAYGAFPKDLELALSPMFGRLEGGGALAEAGEFKISSLSFRSLLNSAEYMHEISGSNRESQWNNIQLKSSQYVLLSLLTAVRKLTKQPAFEPHTQDARSLRDKLHRQTIQLFGNKFFAFIPDRLVHSLLLFTLDIQDPRPMLSCIVEGRRKRVLFSDLLATREYAMHLCSQLRLFRRLWKLRPGDEHHAGHAGHADEVHQHAREQDDADGKTNKNTKTSAKVVHKLQRDVIEKLRDMLSNPEQLAFIKLALQDVNVNDDDNDDARCDDLEDSIDGDLDQAESTPSSLRNLKAFFIDSARQFLNSIIDDLVDMILVGARRRNESDYTAIASMLEYLDVLTALGSSQKTSKEEADRNAEKRARDSKTSSAQRKVLVRVHGGILKALQASTAPNHNSVTSIVEVCYLNNIRDAYPKSKKLGVRIHHSTHRLLSELSLPSPTNKAYEQDETTTAFRLSLHKALLTELKGIILGDKTVDRLLSMFSLLLPLSAQINKLPEVANMLVDILHKDYTKMSPKMLCGCLSGLTQLLNFCNNKNNQSRNKYSRNNHSRNSISRGNAAMTMLTSTSLKREKFAHSPQRAKNTSLNIATAAIRAT